MMKNIYSILAEDENEIETQVTQQIKNVPQTVPKTVQKNVQKNNKTSNEKKIPIVKNSHKLSPNLDKFEIEPSHKTIQKSTQKTQKNDRQKPTTKTTKKAQSTGWEDNSKTEDVQEEQVQDEEQKPEEDEQVIQISLDDYLKENSHSKILLPARKPTSDKKWEKLQQVQKDEELDSLFKPMVSTH